MMPWKTYTPKQLAEELGIDFEEAEQKRKLRKKITNLRKRYNLSQEQLAERVGVSRSRIAQIETGVKLHRISFDVLIKVLRALGCECKVTVKTNGPPEGLAA